MHFMYYTAEAYDYFDLDQLQINNLKIILCKI